jgi:hypothetical protein
MRRLTIGSFDRSSQKMKDASAAKLTTAAHVMKEEANQSSSCPLSSTSWSAASPTAGTVLLMKPGWNESARYLTHYPIGGRTVEIRLPDILRGGHTGMSEELPKQALARDEQRQLHELLHTLCVHLSTDFEPYGQRSREDDWGPGLFMRLPALTLA